MDIYRVDWVSQQGFFYVALTALERGIRLNEAVEKGEAFSDALIWNYGFYTFLYYFRYLSYPFFYGFLISFSLKILDPSYYKPERWLK